MQGKTGANSQNQSAADNPAVGSMFLKTIMDQQSKGKKSNEPVTTILPAQRRLSLKLIAQQAKMYVAPQQLAKAQIIQKEEEMIQ